MTLVRRVRKLAQPLALVAMVLFACFPARLLADCSCSGCCDIAAVTNAAATASSCCDSSDSACGCKKVVGRASCCSKPADAPKATRSCCNPDHSAAVNHSAENSPRDSAATSDCDCNCGSDMEAPAPAVPAHPSHASVHHAEVDLAPASEWNPAQLIALASADREQFLFTHPLDAIPTRLHAHLCVWRN